MFNVSLETKWVVLGEKLFSDNLLASYWLASNASQ